MRYMAATNSAQPVSPRPQRTFQERDQTPVGSGPGRNGGMVSSISGSYTQSASTAGEQSPAAGSGAGNVSLWPPAVRPGTSSTAIALLSLSVICSPGRLAGPACAACPAPRMAASMGGSYLSVK